jgi:hypothetical protein
MLNSMLRSLPYLVHTNRELGLMIEGRKPFAMFSECKDCWVEAVERYLRLFDRPILEGRLTRMDHFAPSLPPNARIVHRVGFALPGEEWRMQAMMDLMTANERWTSAHERRQGELLGYEDWMNDYWLENIFSAQTLP